jgi:hypothetical protein
MSSHRTALIICTAARQEQANNLAFNLTGKSGDKETFRTGLVPADRFPPLAPATHFLANWRCSPSDYQQMQTVFSGIPGIDFHDGDITTSGEVLPLMGLRWMWSQEAYDEWLAEQS